MNETLEAIARALFKSWFIDQLRAPDLKVIQGVTFRDGVEVTADETKSAA